MSIEDSVKEIHEMNACYFRLFVNLDDQLVVVEMQWFDEYDYDQDRFVNKVQYATEQEAKDALLEYKIKLDQPLTIMDRLRVLAIIERQSS